jgi:uncharacterized membrane protein YdjX (TVP38/TMEM64 family)
MSFLFFLGVSAVGRLPGIVGSSIIGGAARANRWVALGILSLAAIMLFAAGMIFRTQLQALVERVLGKKPAAGS